MTYPSDPSRSFSFTGYSQSLGDDSFPGSELDAALDDYAQAISGTNTFLRSSFRSDGKLKNGSVGREQLAVGVVLGFNPPKTWAAGVEYGASDTVFEGSKMYAAALPHTSGDTFAADIALDLWYELIDFGLQAVAADSARVAAELARDLTRQHRDAAVAAENSAAAHRTAVASDRAAIEGAQTAADAAASASQAASDASQTSATEADASATSAHLALTSFSAVWLGEHAAEPETDLNGDPLTGGEVYADTSRGTLRYYSSGKWKDSGSAIAPTRIRATLPAGHKDVLLPFTPSNATLLLIYADGLPQSEDSYTIASQTLTFNTADSVTREIRGWMLETAELGEVPAGGVGAAEIDWSQRDQIVRRLGCVMPVVGKFEWFMGRLEDVGPSNVILDGRTLSRETYADAWAKVQKWPSFNPDSTTRKFWQFSPGDGQVGYTNLVPLNGDQLSAGTATLTPLAETIDGRSNAARIASGGQDWHRSTAAPVDAFEKDALYSVRVKYRAGTSGRVRIVLREETLGLSTSLSGVVGAVGIASIAAGGISSVENSNLGGGVYEIRFQFTPTATGTNWTQSIGPDSATVGAYVDVIVQQTTKTHYQLPYGQGQVAETGTTFTVPNYMVLDGMFVRAIDLSTGRVVGDFEEDALQDHGHQLLDAAEVSSGGSVIRSYGAIGGHNPYRENADPYEYTSFAGGPGVRIAGETRSKNISMIPTMVVGSGQITDPGLLNAQSVLTDVGQATAAIARLQAERPQQMQVIPDGTSSFVLDIRPFRDGNGFCDFDLCLHGWMPSGNDLEVRFQVSIDGGASWIASNWYAQASPYTHSSHATTYAQSGTISNPRLSHATAAIGAGYSLFGHFQFCGSGTSLTVMGCVNSHAADGAFVTWYPNARINAGRVTHVRFFWNPTGTFQQSSRYSLKNNLRAV